MKRHRIREYREGRGTSQKREIVQQRVAANLEAVLEMEVEEGSDEEEGGGVPIGTGSHRYPYSGGESG